MIQRRYEVRRAARHDLNTYSDHLLAEAGAETMLRFVDMARQSFGSIAEMPGRGSPVESADFRLTGMRKRRVDGFPRVLIFYIQKADAIQIVRVLHSAQDWQTLFDAD